MTVNPATTNSGYIRYEDAQPLLRSPAGSIQSSPNGSPQRTPPNGTPPKEEPSRPLSNSPHVSPAGSVASTDSTVSDCPAAPLVGRVSAIRQPLLSGEDVEMQPMGESHAAAVRRAYGRGALSLCSRIKGAWDWVASTRNGRTTAALAVSALETGLVTGFCVSGALDAVLPGWAQVALVATSCAANGLAFQMEVEEIPPYAKVEEAGFFERVLTQEELASQFVQLCQASPEKVSKFVNMVEKKYAIPVHLLLVAAAGRFSVQAMIPVLSWVTGIWIRNIAQGMIYQDPKTDPFSPEMSVDASEYEIARAEHEHRMTLQKIQNWVKDNWSYAITGAIAVVGGALAASNTLEPSIGEFGQTLVGQLSFLLGMRPIGHILAEGLGSQMERIRAAYKMSVYERQGLHGEDFSRFQKALARTLNTILKRPGLLATMGNLGIFASRYWRSPIGELLSYGGIGLSQGIHKKTYCPNMEEGLPESLREEVIRDLTPDERAWYLKHKVSLAFAAGIVISFVASIDFSTGKPNTNDSIFFDIALACATSMVCYWGREGAVRYFEHKVRNGEEPSKYWRGFFVKLGSLGFDYITAFAPISTEASYGSLANIVVGAGGLAFFGTEQHENSRVFEQRGRKRTHSAVDYNAGARW